MNKTIWIIIVIIILVIAGFFLFRNQESTDTTDTGAQQEELPSAEQGAYAQLETPDDVFTEIDSAVESLD